MKACRNLKRQKQEDDTALSGMSVQYANDGCSRCGNFGGLLLCNMVLIDLPDDTNICGSRGQESEGIRLL